jgi:hypothetical protein
MRSDLRNHRISESDLNIPGIIIDCDSLSGYPIVSVDPKNYLFDGPLFGAGKPCVLRPVFGLVAWVGIGTTYRDGELVCVPLGPGRTNNLRRSHGSTAQGAHEGLEVTLHRTRDVRFDNG